MLTVFTLVLVIVDDWFSNVALDVPFVIVQVKVPEVAPFAVSVATVDPSVKPLGVYTPVPKNHSATS